MDCRRLEAPEKEEGDRLAQQTQHDKVVNRHTQRIHPHPSGAEPERNRCLRLHSADSGNQAAERQRNQQHCQRIVTGILRQKHCIGRHRIHHRRQVSRQMRSPRQPAQRVDRGHGEDRENDRERSPRPQADNALRQRRKQLQPEMRQQKIHRRVRTFAHQIAHHILRRALRLQAQRQQQFL